MISPAKPNVVLVRYGAVPEVARCSVPEDLQITRHDQVVVETHRGREVATVLEQTRPPQEPGVELPTPSFSVLRIATVEDLSQTSSIAERMEEFAVWEERIAEWNLDLQLIELEWTLDREKLILYVLNERGPECTKLALQAAAAGLGIIEVQPVGADGPMTLPTGGGCGSCGCH